VSIVAATGEAPRTFADKLNHLFRTVTPAGQNPYSNEEVAAKICERGGPTISATYIWLLRKGRRHNPTIKHVEALAGFFGVPPAYFFDDEMTAKVADELQLLTAMKSLGVKRVALRAAGLSEASIGSIVEIIDRIRELEGLPKSDDSADNTGPTGQATPGSRR